MTDAVCLDSDICPLSQVLQTFNHTAVQMKAFAGNGMSLITQTAFMLWCLSYTKRVDPSAEQSSDDESVGADDWD